MGGRIDKTKKTDQRASEQRERERERDRDRDRDRDRGERERVKRFLREVAALGPTRPA